METGNLNEATAAAVPPVPPATDGWGGARGLFRNLAAGVRIALFRRVGPEELAATPGDLALLAGADLLLNLVTSFLLVGSSGAFVLQAVTTFFFHLPPMLLLGWLAARKGDPAIPATVLPVALVSLSIPLELCHGVLEGAAQLPRAAWLADYLDAPHYYRFFSWWTAAGALFLARLSPSAPRRRAALLLLFLVLLVVPLWFFPRGDLWVEGDGGSESGELHLTGTVLSAQEHLLDGELAALLRGRRGAPSLYLVGFAGDAEQDVFTKELLSVAQLFAERFGTAGRTVLLANNPQTATSLPFATAANLERALVGVGRAMRSDDVLFLYLTSHGSPDHELAVENAPLELAGLTPEMLRRMLARSGITWKVIVVSSCYAGGFIDPLKDDHTLIVTAADATHESFGCTYGEGFTWFGRAYFDEALRRTRSFTAAFAEARETIRQWEKRDGETPSNPQIWVGKAIAGKLARLEKRLAAAGGGAAARGAPAR